MGQTRGEGHGRPGRNRRVWAAKPLPPSQNHTWSEFIPHTFSLADSDVAEPVERNNKSKQTAASSSEPPNFSFLFDSQLADKNIIQTRIDVYSDSTLTAL